MPVLLKMEESNEERDEGSLPGEDAQSKCEPNTVHARVNDF